MPALPSVSRALVAAAAWMRAHPSSISPRSLDSGLLRRIFWSGLLLRLAYITLAHTYRIRLFADHFQFGWEMGRVGRALATGHGFADPFMGHSGPTAWFPPLYPLLIGAVFRLCGVYTPLSAWILFATNSVFSAATAPAVYEIAARSFNRRAALWSGWLWALYPAALQYATHWIWDMAITTCLFSWILVLALRARDIHLPPLLSSRSHAQESASPPPHPHLLSFALQPLSSFAAGGGSASSSERPHPHRQTPTLWATFGFLWGLVALLNSSLLTFLPFCGLWMAWPQLQTRSTLPSALRNAALAALVCAGCIAPWIVRNYLVFHAFVPMRANLGAELYMSSLESNNGFPWGGAVSIFEATPDMQRYRALGELAFCRERGHIAQTIFRAHPGRFRSYTLKRIWFFWAGVPHPFEYKASKSALAHAPANIPANARVRAVPKTVFVELSRDLNYCFLSLGGLLGLALALHRRQPAATLYAGAFVCLPLAYYLVTVQARFRAPLEPLIFILTTFLFQSTRKPHQVA